MEIVHTHSSITCIGLTHSIRGFIGPDGNLIFSGPASDWGAVDSPVVLQIEGQELNASRLTPTAAKLLQHDLIFTFRYGLVQVDFNDGSIELLDRMNDAWQDWGNVYLWDGQLLQGQLWDRKPLFPETSTGVVCIGWWKEKDDPARSRPSAASWAVIDRDNPRQSEGVIEKAWEYLVKNDAPARVVRTFSTGHPDPLGAVRAHVTYRHLLQSRSAEYAPQRSA